MALYAAAVLGLGPAAPAFAQTSSAADRAYCDKLIALYGRYLSGDEFRDRQTSMGGVSLEGRLAVAKCREGDTATGIPILERKLRDNGFTLPSRN